MSVWNVSRRHFPTEEASWALTSWRSPQWTFSPPSLPHNPSRTWISGKEVWRTSIAEACHLPLSVNNPPEKDCMISPNKHWILKSTNYKFKKVESSVFCQIFSCNIYGMLVAFLFLSVSVCLCLSFSVTHTHFLHNFVWNLHPRKTHRRSLVNQSTWQDYPAGLREEESWVTAPFPALPPPRGINLPDSITLHVTWLSLEKETCSKSLHYGTFLWSVWAISDPGILVTHDGLIKLR